jgi:hypothetical protein
MAAREAAAEAALLRQREELAREREEVERERAAAAEARRAAAEEAQWAEAARARAAEEAHREERIEAQKADIARRLASSAKVRLGGGDAELEEVMERARLLDARWAEEGGEPYVAAPWRAAAHDRFQQDVEAWLEGGRRHSRGAEALAPYYAVIKTTLHCGCSLSDVYLSARRMSPERRAAARLGRSSIILSQLS